MIKKILLIISCFITFLSAQDVISDDAKLFCRTFGQGNPLLVIHGGPGLSQEYLLPQMSELAENNLVIFYDQRGCGQSDGAINERSMTIDVFLNDIETIRKEFGLKKMTVLGHSWGGLLAMHYAINYPESVEKLILLNSIPASNEEFGLFIAEWMKRTAPIQDRLAQIYATEEFEQGDPSTHEHMHRLIFQTYCFLPEKAALLSLNSSRIALQNGEKVNELMRENVLMQPFNLHAKLQNVLMPTLIVHGEYDPVPYSTAQTIHNSIPGSKLFIIPRCGHFPYVEEPETLFKTIKDFLK